MEGALQPLSTASDWTILCLTFHEGKRKFQLRPISSYHQLYYPATQRVDATQSTKPIIFEIVKRIVAPSQPGKFRLSSRQPYAASYNWQWPTWAGGTGGNVSPSSSRTMMSRAWSWSLKLNWFFNMTRWIAVDVGIVNVHIRMLKEVAIPGTVRPPASYSVAMKHTITASNSNPSSRTQEKPEIRFKAQEAKIKERLCQLPDDQPRKRINGEKKCLVNGTLQC